MAASEVTLWTDDVDRRRYQIDIVYPGTWIITLDFLIGWEEFCERRCEDSRGQQRDDSDDRDDADRVGTAATDDDQTDPHRGEARSDVASDDGASIIRERRFTTRSRRLGVPEETVDRYSIGRPPMRSRVALSRNIRLARYLRRCTHTRGERPRRVRTSPPRTAQSVGHHREEERATEPVR